MGANLGHLGNLKQVAQRAINEGHKVWIVAKDLERVDQVFDGLPVQLMQAPALRTQNSAEAETLCFSQLINNTCYRNREDLCTYVRAWRTLFLLIAPDAVFFDHSPLALAASWECEFKKVLMGNGFTLPPTRTPLFGVFPCSELTEEQSLTVRKAEYELLQNLTDVYRRLAIPPIKQVADIYRQVDSIVRLTIAEFDHFGERPVGGYVGVWPSFGGAKAKWKASKKIRVFAYLQPFEKLPLLLSQLAQAEIEVLVYSPTLNPADRNKLSTPSIRFSDEALDLRQVSETVDFAITHGNHDTSVQLSLLGTPLMTIPRHQEQYFFSIRHEQQGFGVVCYQDQACYKDAIQTLVEGQSCKRKVMLLKQRYGGKVEQGAGALLDDIVAKLS
tara:strand:+ start:696 stop:1856 length:1161 start_codon:yes stop_codon:yes gene_type:complete